MVSHFCTILYRATTPGKEKISDSLISSSSTLCLKILIIKINCFD